MNTNNILNRLATAQLHSLEAQGMRTYLDARTSGWHRDLTPAAATALQHAGRYVAEQDQPGSWHRDISLTAAAAMQRLAAR